MAQEIQVTETQGKNGPIVQITPAFVPDDMYIACPLKQFKGARSVKNICSQCKYFKGFEDVAPKAEDFERRYFVVCAFPMQRRMAKMELEG